MRIAFVFILMHIPAHARYVEDIFVHDTYAADAVLISSEEEKIILTDSNQSVVETDESIKPKVAIIIDDVAYLGSSVRALINSRFPLTLAILPHHRHSGVIAEMARDNGKSVLLHQPMQGSLEFNGKGKLICLGQGTSEIETILASSLNSLNGCAAGVNNHMGSVATADPEIMRAVLSTLQGHGLFFLDSYTSAKSIAINQASMMDIKVLKRDVFLDNKLEEEYISAKFQLLIEKAITNGSAVGIAHARSMSVETLLKLLEENNGVDYISILELYGLQFKNESTAIENPGGLN